MARQVDIKALVSHLVKGDGEDRCRICMGDTSEGQVFLGDTVMMDGTRAVTLAELLAVITGIEVWDTREQPSGICRLCSEETITAAQFRLLCQQSNRHWSNAVDMLLNIDDPQPPDKVFYVFFDGESESVVKDQVKEAKSTDQAYNRLTESLEVSTKKRIARKAKQVRKLRLCQCPECDKTFSCSYDLNKHLKNSGTRVCYYCSEIIHKKQLRRHIVKCSGKELFECSKCNKLFTEKDGLIEHANLSHGSGFDCQSCGEGFANARALRAHEYTHNLFSCNGCSLTFENRKCHKYHSQQCKENKKTDPTDSFVCHDCGSVYNKKPSLRIHIVQKHLNVLPYKCKDCGKRTSTIAHLRSHQLTHKQVRKEFPCAICGAKMRTELGYVLHQRIHTGEKPYQCSECGDRFLSASRRLDHIKRRHMSSKEMPHACPKCPMRFVRPFEMRRHIAHEHASKDVIEK